MGIRKNQSGQKWRVFAFDRTTNLPKTGDAANITAKIKKDWGANTATNDTNPTETEDGYYEFDLTQAESAADWLDLYPESTTPNIQVIGVPGGMPTVPDNFQDAVIDADGAIAADIQKIDTDAGAAMSLMHIANKSLFVEVVDDAGNSASTFELDISSSDDYFHDAEGGSLLTFANPGSVNFALTRRITDYNNTTHFVTVSPAFPNEPSAGDVVVIESREVAFNAALLNRIADHVRRRQQSNVEASADGDTINVSSEYGAIQAMLESNLVDNPGNLTIYKTDGTTELAQRPVTTDPDAEPITGVS
jgi:hypothetical protein